jgi:uncharacterized protein YegL
LKAAERRNSKALDVRFAKRFVNLFNPLEEDMITAKKSLSERLSSVELMPTVPAGVLVCVLDRSGSMLEPTNADNAEPKIAGLKRGIEAALAALRNPPGGVRPMIGFVTFGGDIQKVPPVPATAATIPALTADGSTPLGGAIEAGLDMIECALGELNTRQVPFKAPTLALFTDGIGNDEDPRVVTDAMQHALQMVNDVKLQLLGVVVNADDQRRLLDLGFAQVEIVVNGADWSRKFRWVSLTSMSGAKKPGNAQKPLTI